MNWSHIAQGSSDALTILLIARLLTLRLHSVYRVFCAFLLFQLAASFTAFLETVLHDPRLDYRITWMSLRPIGWVLSLWMVYGILKAILAHLPGILRFSRKLLNTVFVCSILVALLTARPEYSAGLARFPDRIDQALGVVFVLERVISMVALLVLVSILAFMLWFPVQMPRNLAIFSVGFVVYFAANTALFLILTFGSHHISRGISDVLMFVVCACCAYWSIFITAGGESRPVRVGHSWRTDEQERLIGQLEAMNTALLRARR